MEHKGNHQKGATATAQRRTKTSAAPLIGQRSKPVQEFGTVIPLPNGLDESVCTKVVGLLNKALADTMVLRDLYKKHHWQVAGPTFYALHLLFDKHYEEQSRMVDEIAERIQLLGGISIALAQDVAENATMERIPRDREEVPVQLSRLLEAHEQLLRDVRAMAKVCDDLGDCGSNDLLVSSVIRTNELQVWFLAEHLVALPVVEAE